MNASRPDNVCARCNKTFSRKADCIRHARLHDGIKPFRCEAAGCGKRFAQYTALKTHRNVHTGLKPFKCGVSGCRSTFGDPSSCTRHRKEMHQPRQPFKCPASGCTSSILRLSAFKAHLRKHGLDPESCVNTLKRDQSSTKVRRSIGPVRVKEERVSNPHSSPHDQISLPVLPDCWDPLFSLPGNPPTPQMMQPEQLSGTALSTSSPLLLAPSPRIVPECNAGYYLTPSRASSAISSPYSSSMAPSPVLTSGMGIDYMSDVSLQLRPYLTRSDWTSNVWQDRGIQFAG